MGTKPEEKRSRAPGRRKKARNGADKGLGQQTIWLIVVVLSFGLAVGFSVARQLTSSQQGSTVQNPAGGSNEPGYLTDPANHETHDPMWPQIQTVAEQFYCGCGECGDMVLAECVCDMDNGGLREKAFIRQKLTEGYTVEEVTEMVKQKYGRSIPAASEGKTAGNPA